MNAYKVYGYAAVSALISIDVHASDAKGALEAANKVDNRVKWMAAEFSHVVSHGWDN